MDNGAPPDRYRVDVSFIVDKEGLVSEVRAENDSGYELAAEAVRVIVSGPNRIPVIQYNRKVIYRQRQSITFVVEGDTPRKGRSRG